jgi:3-oxosteroid 1-dehydrogenase
MLRRQSPCWLVLDARSRRRYLFSPMAAGLRKLREAGTLVVADTLDDLARLMHLAPERLAATVERFNGFARSGVDEDFHRGEDPWDIAWGDPDNEPNPCLGTLERAPFFAIPMVAGATSTRGGLRIDARARVLSAATGEPIPGLFASGNCSNGTAAGAYVGPGATIGPAMTFGYLAGRQAAGDTELTG